MKPLSGFNVVTIVQARMASSRLPGKVLRELGGEPMLAWVVERCRRASTVNSVLVATTTDSADDPVVALCAERGWPVFRGSQFDVLDRFYQAARWAKADVVVRVTADCPLIDPKVVDQVVREFFEREVDFAANRLPPPWKRTFPIGLDTEVCTFSALERAWREATQKYEREHVMPYLYDEPGRFKIFILQHEPDLGHLRWTVDTPEDLDLLRAIVSRLKGRMDFSWEEVLAIFEREPQLAEINASVNHKSGFDVDDRAK
ncbi:spore coat polysaccharide biosynthesis protein F, CMP-KDO synthetase homolog [Anaerolinea thermolimosa]|uniref:cytidylyltransferase domain-containing protein n=1 Tax=Anaerolinea thermolimosa TaxID=229919 RepID=UPI000785251B|nr:glycosyltransferase family protein [Anaerolinea thermolimosa]GAP05296.1 spore coat polysaccharide biosynthesis protein F, CMP-KDO synthetase homolog [Anaerolinea thermolimosa]